MKELIVITGRSIKQGENVEDKLSDDYFNAVSIIELDEEDMEELGVKEGDRVKVKTEHGEVVLKVKKARGKQRGIAFIPFGPYFSILISAKTRSVGMPLYKGIRAKIEPTEEDVKRIEEIIEELKR